jgi:hypothetical protein
MNESYKAYHTFIRLMKVQLWANEMRLNIMLLTPFYVAFPKIICKVFSYHHNLAYLLQYFVFLKDLHEQKKFKNPTSPPYPPKKTMNLLSAYWFIGLVEHNFYF